MIPSPQEIGERFGDLQARVGKGRIDSLRRVLTPVDVAAGAILIEEGAPHETLHLLWEGTLAVQVALASGARWEIGRLGPGSVVGEVSFIDGGLASATVTAVTGAQLLTLSRAALGELERSDAHLAAGVMQALCDSLAARVRDASNRLEEAGPSAASAPSQPSKGAGSGSGSTWRDVLGVLFGTREE